MIPTTTSPGTRLVDVLVIGAGPAALSFATGIARQLYTAVLFDSATFRNDCTQHMHNVLGWDHRHPAEFRSAGRKDLISRYPTIEFQNTTIEIVRQVENNGYLFEAIDKTGHAWYGRKLVLAMGVKDLHLGIPGYSECWGTAIFPCLFCDGYEERGQESVGFLAIGPLVTVPRVLHQCRQALRLSRSVTVYTGGDLSLAEQLQVAISDSRINVDCRVITRLENIPGTASVRVHHAGGQSKEEGFMVRPPNLFRGKTFPVLTSQIHNPATQPNGPFVKQLSLKTTPTDDVEVKAPFGETSMAGVFAIGDCANMVKAVVPAVHSGTMAAAGVVTQLQIEPVPSWEF